MPRRVSFDYDRVLTQIGFLWVPMARVEIEHAGSRLQMDMTIDSGADFTLFPRHVGLALGMRRRGAAPVTLAGIAGATPSLLHRAVLRIGPFRFDSRVAWAQHDDVPVLLGRVDVLDRLVVTLDGKRRRVTLSE